MRFRTQAEATAFVKALMDAKGNGKREFMTAKLDSVPQWQKDKTPPPALDGSPVEAVYLAYRPPTKRQVEAAKVAKLAGVELQVIKGRLVDVRTCKDGTCQVLFTNGLRDENGAIPWRGPNVDKGILAYLAVGEGLGESVDEILSRVPDELLSKLKAMKEGKYKAKLPAVDLVAAVARNSVEAPAPEGEGPDENRMKLR